MAEENGDLEPSEASRRTVTAGKNELIGRDSELVSLRAALADVVHGCGRLSWISGEPGIGKTRLAEQVAREARASGANVAWGRCWVEEGAPDLWPWVQVVRTCLRRVDEGTLRKLVGPHASELTDLVASFASSPPDRAQSAAPAAARFRLFNAIAHFLDQYSRLAPLVIILEDLHRGDPQSLLLLQFFTQEQRERPILVVATYREPSLPANPALVRSVLEAMREPGSERIELAGLNVSETRRFVEMVVGREPPLDFAQVLHRGTAGNPLFLGECARQLVVARNEGAELQWPPAEELFLTAELTELIDQRLAMLTRDQRAALRAAAVLGCEFRLESLGTACERSIAGDWAAAVQASEKFGFLRQGRDVGWLCFAQTMVRQRLLESDPASLDEALPSSVADLLLAEAPNGTTMVVAKTDAAVFRKEGAFWTITFAGRTCRMSDAKGLAYIGLLLRHPGESIHVSEIVHLGQSESQVTPRAFQCDESTAVRLGLGDAGALLDRQAKDAYKRRLVELQAELEQAQQCNDGGRAERARQEIEILTEELTAAVGLGGRDRRVGSDAERARVNVTRAIARAIQKIDEFHPDLSRHLTQTIRTGTFCTYAAEPATARTWDL